MTDALRLGVVLSNPYATKIIATSLKKTDKIDVYKLAELLRGRYIATSHVLDRTTVEYRQVVRHRDKITRDRTRYKNLIYGITLKNGIRTLASGFTHAHMRELQKMEDYRIDSYLEMLPHPRRSLNMPCYQVESI